MISFLAKLENLEQHRVVWFVVSKRVGVCMYYVPFEFAAFWLFAFALEHWPVLISPVDLLVHDKEVGTIAACQFCLQFETCLDLAMVLLFLLGSDFDLSTILSCRVGE